MPGTLNSRPFRFDAVKLMDASAYAYEAGMLRRDTELDPICAGGYPNCGDRKVACRECDAMSQVRIQKGQQLFVRYGTDSIPA